MKTNRVGAKAGVPGVMKVRAQFFAVAAETRLGVTTG